MIFLLLLLAFTSGSILVAPPSISASSKSQISVLIGSLVYECLINNIANQSGYFECIRHALPKDQAVREFLFEDFTLDRRRQNFSGFIVDQESVMKSLSFELRPVENVYFEIIVATIYLRDMARNRERRIFGVRRSIRMLMLLLIDDIRDMVIEDILLCLNSLKVSKATEDFEIRLKIANHLAFLVKNIDKKHREMVFGFIKTNIGEAVKRGMINIFASRHWLAHPAIKKNLKTGFFFDDGPKKELFIEENWELFLKSRDECFIYLVRLNGTSRLLRQNKQGIINVNLKEGGQVDQIFIISKLPLLQTKLIVDEISHLLRNSPGDLRFFLALHEIGFLRVKKQPLSWSRQFTVSEIDQIGGLLYDVYGPALLAGETKFINKYLNISANLARFLKKPSKIIESPTVWDVLNNPKDFFQALHYDYFLLKPKFQIALALYLLRCYTFDNLPAQDRSIGHYLKILSLHMIPKRIQLLGGFLTCERIIELYDLLSFDPDTQDGGCSKFCGLICSLFKKKKGLKAPEEENRLERMSALLNNIKKDVAEIILGCKNRPAPLLYLMPYLPKGLPFFNQIFFLKTPHYFIKAVISFHQLSHIIIFIGDHTIGLNGCPQFYALEIDPEGAGRIVQYKQNQIIDLIPVKYIFFFNSPHPISQFGETQVHTMIEYVLKKLKAGHPLAKFILFNMQLNCIQIFKNGEK